MSGTPTVGVNDIGHAINVLIRSNPELASAFGNRIFNDHLPQSISAYPAVVLWVVSSDADDHLLGPLGLERARIQFDVLGRNRAESVKYRFAIRNHVCGFAGSVAGVTIREVMQASGGRHTTDRAEAGSQEYRFVTSQDLHVAYLSEV